MAALLEKAEKVPGAIPERAAVLRVHRVRPVLPVRPGAWAAWAALAAEATARVVEWPVHRAHRALEWSIRA